MQPNNVEENYRRACSFIRDAASKGAVLAVLPEQVSPNLPTVHKLRYVDTISQAGHLKTQASLYALPIT